MDKGFTNKEMLKILLVDVKELREQQNIIYTLAIQTNGKVKIHTKLISALAGAGFTVALAFGGWILTLR